MNARDSGAAPRRWRRARHARRLRAAALATLLAASCVRAPAPERPASPAETRAVLAALAAREQAMRGLRISMLVRVTGTDAAPLLSSPAYLAIDGPGALRLQVLSPFGPTVFALTIRDADYELARPLTGERRHGVIDLAALAGPGLPADERMIVSLALLFRAKIDPAACRGVDARTVACAIEGGAIVARVTVDGERRPLSERYERADGTALVSVRFTDYRSGSDTLPGRIEITDAAAGTTLIASVRAVRPAATGRS